MLYRKTWYLFVTVMCLSLTAVAQQADFIADKASGCSPLAVSFTNKSTGFSSSAVYAWDFGNTNSSALENPGTTYNEEGDYIVTLTIIDGNKKSLKSMAIKVYKKPVVDFSVDIARGCSPLAVTFDSHSEPGDGTISTYTWDFGDGIAEAGQGTQGHTYNVAKIISPSLTVTNSHGCFSTATKPQMIEVLPRVIASFNPSQTVLCSVQDAISFANTSAGTGTLTYNWDFGDNTTSTASQPQHTYAQAGTYLVKLTATSMDGCVSDTVLQTPINVADFHTKVSVQPVVCQSTPAIFTDISTPVATIRQWIVDGAVTTDTSGNQLQYTFAAPGNYKVDLINIYETCPDTSRNTITVQLAPDLKSFVAALQGSCGAPVAVNFQDTTSGNTGWLWDFGNGATASGQAASHLFAADGVYNITLTTSNAAGCTAQIIQPVNVHKTSVVIASSEGDLGCETKTTVFSAISEEDIAQYDWDFGDGTAHSSDATPQHLFTSPGHYTIALDYITTGGCKGKSIYTLDVYKRPEFDFTAVPGTTVCGSTPVSFDVSGTNIVGQYLWDFGDGKGYVPLSIPYRHSYQHDSVYSVSLIIDNNGCRDTVTKSQYLTVLPPFPHIASKLNTCDGNRGLMTFTDTSQKAQQYSWDFGDNTALSVYTSPQLQVQHTYAQSGAYHLTLTVTNGSCSAIDSMNVFVLLKQNPVLSAANTTFCSADAFITTVSGMDVNPYYSHALGYKVDTVQYKSNTGFNGGISVTDNGSGEPFGINLTGVNVNETALRIITTSDYFGCADTTNYLSFQSLGPIADFKVTDNRICFKTPAIFTDASLPSHNSPIVKWDWYFGDSLSQVNVQGTSVMHRYAQPGIYEAILTVTDAKGCSASTSADAGQVTATGPQAAFTISENPVLPATPVVFYNQSLTANTNESDNRYTWNYGDGSSIKNQPYAEQVSHIYSHESIDTVSLIAFNTAESCADTALQVVYVKNPNLSFTYTTTYVNPESGCPPVIGSFVNASLNTNKVSWNFGDGNTADNLDNAGHIYEKPGIYKVTLYGYFLDGTIDSVFQMVTIKGPFAELKTVKPFACGSELITLTASSANTRNFTWDFGDGTLLNNSDTSAGHRYLTAGVYTPSLIVSDGNNCRFPFFLTKPIIIDALHLSINKNVTVACDSSLILFSPTVVSEAKTLGLPLSYHWDFGTGNAKDTANTESHYFTYNRVGSYAVTLSGASPYGCIDVTTDSIIVQPTPRAYIAGPVQLCQDDSAAFQGSATRTVTWQWQFGNGDVIRLQNTPQHTFVTPGIDSVFLVVNDKGCYDTAWQPVLVNAKPIINPSPLTARLCQSDSVQLQAHDGNVFNWTPNRRISGATTATPYVFPDTATEYYVEVKNEAGCINNDSIHIDVTQRFNIKVPSPVYICPGGVAQLEASGADNYHWLDNGVSNPDIANPTASTYIAKTYTVVGADNYGCFTDTAVTQVLTALLPTVNAGMDLTTFAGTPVSLLASGSPDVVTWQWTPGLYLDCDTCSSLSITPRSDLQYVVKVTNSSGCVAFDSVQVHILCKGSLVQIPSAFTPNGDGTNERFTVKGSGIKEVRHFAVFDRLGEKLFETTNLTLGETSYTGWDGTYKNRPMPPGTYVYIADLVCDTGELFRYKGTVVLIR